MKTGRQLRTQLDLTAPRALLTFFFFVFISLFPVLGSVRNGLGAECRLVVSACVRACVFFLRMHVCV